MQLSDPIKISTVIVISAVVSACGGSSNGNSNKNGPDPIFDVSIPTTAAVSPIAAPELSKLAQQPKTDEALLRHIYRDSFHGLIDDDEIDSPNAKVEQKDNLGLYQPIQPDIDHLYHISLENNGLVYFRVTNTKPNGSVRVHTFEGVPAGTYVTFDTTNIQVPEREAVACVDVDIRLVNLPTNPSSTARLQIGGLTISKNTSDIVNGQVYYQGQKAYIQKQQLCPIKNNDTYLAMAVFENSANDIFYGFNYYQNIQAGDVIELDMGLSAKMLPWQSEKQLGKDIQLTAYRKGWNAFQAIYSYTADSANNGFIPTFPELEFTSYRLHSDKKTADNSISFTIREFDNNTSEIQITADDFQLSGVDISPVKISWENAGSKPAKVVSGIVFNASLTETYAFISADPEIITQGRFNFPIDDLALTIDSVLAGVTLASGYDSTKAYIGQASLYSGFLYYENQAQLSSLNTDIQISASGNDLLQRIINEAIQQ